MRSSITRSLELLAATVRTPRRLKQVEVAKERTFRSGMRRLSLRDSYLRGSFIFGESDEPREAA